MIAFVVDSSFDMPVNVKLKYPIYYAPLRVYIDGKEYVDKVSMTIDQFYDMLEIAKDFSTSLPNPKEFEDLINRLYKEYDHIYVLSISSKLSGTYNMFKAVCEPLADKVTVLDLKAASFESYAIYRGIVHFLEKGKQITQELVNEIKKNTRIFFGVMTLDFLEKGGRIGKAKALLGRVLRIKPILTVNEEGEVESVGMARKLTSLSEKIIEKAEEFIKERGLKDPYLMVGYGSKKFIKYVDDIKKHFGIKDVVAQISAAVGVHTGPELFGLVVSKY
ncbi:DegV family protein [Thermosipho atlanticus]|uniref:EDD domain protein, DegV family n=1 Tax=Thermosipho atlanticus DSM 15807 TaxID=1123380 RepID=A0A1M5RSW8_9BACT|nr:DegV family protein [Thermosipho atlanticus]SHH29442.1 EDD domain protein, DegV family [Thermosipho atlanticus DSM 15807]